MTDPLELLTTKQDPLRLLPHSMPDLSVLPDQKKAEDALSMAATFDLLPSNVYRNYDTINQNMSNRELHGKAFASGFGNTYKLAGSALEWQGFDEQAKVYRDFGERLTKAYAFPMNEEEVSWKNLSDSKWWATNVTQSIPFTLSLIPAALVAAYAGAGTATAVGLGALGRLVLGAIGGAVVSRPMESALEAGGVYEEELRRSGDVGKADEAANTAFWLNMTLTGLDAAEFAAAFTPLRMLGSSATKSLARRILATGGKLGVVGGLGAGEEIGQTIIEQVSLGDEIDWSKTKTPAFVGGLFGVGMGGAGSVYTALRGRVVKDMPVDTKKELDKAISEGLAEGMSQQNAELRALDKIAETPEGEEHIKKIVEELKDPTTIPKEEVRVAPAGEVVKQPWKMTREELEVKYKKAGDVVDGRTVRSEIPNMGSISASVDNPTILPGIYEIPLSEFEGGLTGKHYSAKGTKRIAELADEITASGEINPLIVVIDAEGPYILEGGTRAESLYKSGAKSFPAKVVLDEGSFYDATKQALAEGKPVPPEVLADYPGLKPTTEPGKVVAEVDTTFEFGANVPEIPVTEISTDFKDHAEGYLSGLLDMVKMGEPGKRVSIERVAVTEDAVIGLASTYPEFMRGKGWTRKEVITALDKVIKGGKLGEKQQEILLSALEESVDLFWRDVEGMGIEVGDVSIEAAFNEIFSRYGISRAKAKETTSRLKETRKALKQKKVPAKKRIRIATGQVKVGEVIEIKEIDALNLAMKKAAQAARGAYSAGDKAGVAKAKAHFQVIAERAKERKALRDSIKAMVKNLKALKPDKMAPQFGNPIKKLLDELDLTKPTKKTLIKLQSRKDFLERNIGYVDMPKKYLDELSRLEKIPVRDMTINELEKVYAAVMLHAKLDTNLKTIKVGRRERKAGEVLSESISLMKPQEKLEKDFVSSQIASGGVSFSQQIKDFFGLHQQHYNTVLEKLFGINTVPYKVLWTGVKKGVITKYRINQTAADMLDYEAFQKKHKINDLHKWRTETVHPEGGMELMRDERASLWRHSRNADNLLHLLKGGVGFKFSNRPLEVFNVTKESLEKTLNSMTDVEIEYANMPENVGYFDYLFKEQAAVYYDVNMVPLKQVKGFYHPIEVMPSEIGDIDIGEEPVLVEDQVIRVGLKKGQLIERIRSGKPVYLNPLTHDLNKARDVASRYVGLEKPLREASKLLYNKRFKNELTKRYDNGFEIWKNIEQALKDIAGQRQGSSQMGRWLLGSKNLLTTSILGYNPFSYVIQIPSSVLYMTYVKPEYYWQGVQETIAHPKEVFEKHMRYEPEYRERVEGGYSRDVMDAIKSLQKKQFFDDKELVSWGMKGLKLSDLVAVTPGMQGAVLQALAELEAGELSPSIKMALDMENSDIVGLSSEQKLELAYDFARWCTGRTQPMFSPEHRSYLSRGPAPYQLVTMFGAYISGARNMIERAAIHAQRTQTRESYNALAMALFGVFVLNTLAMLARDDARDYLLKRKQRPWTIGRIARIWTGYIFGLRDIASSIINKLERGTYVGKDPEIPLERVGEVFTDAATHGFNTMLGPNHKREKSAKKFVDKGIEFYLMTRGIPYRTPKAIITAPFKERKK